jgi:hypothetical protein
MGMPFSELRKAGGRDWRRIWKRYKDAISDMFRIL